MKKFVIYFANGVIEYTEQKSMKNAEIYANKRSKEISMVVLIVYEQNEGTR